MLTAENRVNLEKLATYLEGLPENYRHFRMDSWVVARSTVKEARYARENGGVSSCGTVACAAGHGPAAGVLVPSEFVIQRGRRFVVDWASYAGSLFCGGDISLQIWMFGGAWTSHDNHHYGAAARIRYVLDKGGEPDDFGFPESGYLSLYAPYRIDAKTQANA